MPFPTIPHEIPAWVVDPDTAADEGTGQGRSLPLAVDGRRIGTVTPLWSDDDGVTLLVDVAGEPIPAESVPNLAGQLCDAVQVVGSTTAGPVDVQAVEQRVASYASLGRLPAEQVGRAQRLAVDLLRTFAQHGIPADVVGRVTSVTSAAVDATYAANAR